MSCNDRPWVDGLTFGKALAHTAERHGGQDALVFPSLKLRFTYKMFEDNTRQAARALIALGIKSGDHLGIWATNVPQWVILQFAAAQVGAVLVNINPAYRSQELAYVLKQADINALFLIDHFKTSNYFEILEAACPEILSHEPGNLNCEKVPKLRHVICLNNLATKCMLKWDQFLYLALAATEDELAIRQNQIMADEIVSIQYTSGTTGFPKGAMLTHRNLLLNAFYVGRRMAFSEQDRLCIPVPFYHCFGCVMGTLMCTIYGAAMVIPAEMFDPLATLTTIQEEKCSAVYGVPTMYLALLQHPQFRKQAVPSLRTGIMAGSPCPLEVMRAVVNDMGVREITIAYGLTEASPVITQTEKDDGLEQRISTVGKPLPDLEVRIVVPGTMNDVASGESGELIVRGHGVMKGYYRKNSETAEAITPDGWLHSGDLAAQTPDGYYRITGRLKDMIVRGGENIYPREIEDFLYNHPQIAEVQVVGLPDDKYVEEVSAWIRLKTGEALEADQVREYCRGRIAHYKIPRYVVFVEDYPKTVTGKVQKYKLREMGIARFGLAKAAAIETA